MNVTDTYSPRLRARMSDEDWAAIRAAGPGEARFGRGFRGTFTCTIVVPGGVGIGNDLRSPRAAFDKALSDLRSVQLDTLLGGPAA